MRRCRFVVVDVDVVIRLSPPTLRASSSDFRRRRSRTGLPGSRRGGSNGLALSVAVHSFGLFSYQRDMVFFANKRKERIDAFFFFCSAVFFCVCAIA